MPQSSDRIFFLDNLRAFVVVSVVVLHGIMNYMDAAPAWWYVTDAQHSPVFTAVAMLVDVPIMPVMFFVAAYFTLPTLLKRTPKTFLKDKFIRIGAPWIFGVLLLAPPTAYLAYYSRKIPMGLFQFWATDFWGDRYQQSVYWFLGVLFLFFLLFSLAWWLRGWTQPVVRCSERPSWKLLGAFWLLIVLSLTAMHEWNVSDFWFTGGYVFAFQPRRMPLYVAYFTLGISAWLNRWFTPDGYKPRLAPWAVVWALSGVLYLGSRFNCGRFDAIRTIRDFGQNHLFGQSPFWLGVYSAALYSTFCFSSLLAGTAFFQRYVNGAGPIQRNLTASSYGIYFIHPLIIYPLACGFMTVTCPLYLKAALVTLLGLSLSWAVSALILRKTPILRQVF